MEPDSRESEKVGIDRIEENEIMYKFEGGPTTSPPIFLVMPNLRRQKMRCIRLVTWREAAPGYLYLRLSGQAIYKADNIHRGARPTKWVDNKLVVVDDWVAIDPDEPIIPIRSGR